MKVRGAGEVVEVDVRKLQVHGGAQIGEDVAIFCEGKDYGDAGIFVRKDFDAGNVDTALLEALDAKFAERVGSDARGKTHAAAEKGDIVREDGRGAAEGHGKVIGNVFPLRLEHGGKAVEDQVGVEFAKNA